MKKFFLVCFILLISSAKVFSADYYSVGVDDFKKGAYDKAASNFEHAIKLNPKNVNARYYLAQVYLVQKRIEDAKNQYLRIILLAPNSDAGILSQKGLSLIKQSYSKNSTITSIDELARYKDNYLDYVLANDRSIKKWESFPINVYIQNKKQKSAVEKAFMQWQDKSKKLISFNFVKNPTDAKIKVNFKDKLESTSTKDSFFAGFSKPAYEGKYIAKSNIEILTLEPGSKKEFEDNFIYAITLHEIGHSLGFIGHSPDENDIMFAFSSEPKIELTERDINTLNVFYRIDEKTLLARNTGQTDVKLQQALDYIKKTPKKSIGWTNLGDIYMGKKMYSDAIKSYQKAASLEPDRASVYHSLGIAYRLSGDKQNSYFNFKKACDLDKSNTFYISQLAAISSQTGHKDIAKKYIDAYLKANPDGISDEHIKKLINYR